MNQCLSIPLNASRSGNDLSEGVNDTSTKEKPNRALGGVCSMKKSIGENGIPVYDADVKAENAVRRFIGNDAKSLILISAALAISIVLFRSVYTYHLDVLNVTRFTFAAYFPLVFLVGFLLGFDWKAKPPNQNH